MLLDLRQMYLTNQNTQALTASSVSSSVTLTTAAMHLLALVATAVGSTASILKNVGKFLTASAVASGASILKAVAKGLSVSVTSSPAFVKAVAKAMIASTVAGTASVVKTIGKRLNATVTGPIASISTAANHLQALLATAVSATASMTEQFFSAAFGKIGSWLIAILKGSKGV